MLVEVASDCADIARDILIVLLCHDGAVRGLGLPAGKTSPALICTGMGAGEDLIVFCVWFYVVYMWSANKTC